MLMRVVRTGIVKTLGMLGYDVFVKKKNSLFDYEAIDKNMLSYYLNNDDRIKLYYEGIEVSNVAWSDNLSKQFRYYGLQQLAEHVLVRNIQGDFVECGCWRGHSAYILAKTVVFVLAGPLS